MASERGEGFGFAPAHDAPIPYMQRIRDYYVALGYGAPYEWAHYAKVPFRPLRKPLAKSRVAIITTAGILAPVTVATPGLNLNLLVIAMGAGSLILSHVNDGGFWLVKEYLGLSMYDTFKSWTVAETVLSVSGLLLTLLLNSIIG